MSMRRSLVTGLFMLMVAATPAMAESGDTAAYRTTGDSLPLRGTIRLTPDKPELIRLEQDAGSVIIANPMHAEVMMDSARVLVVMPRQPGATSFTVLDVHGRVILERNVIVSAASDQYVRIRRMCGGGAGGGNCEPANYYYCPDGCYEVSAVPGKHTSSQVPAPVGGGYQIPDDLQDINDLQSVLPPGAVMRDGEIHETPSTGAVPVPDDAPEYPVAGQGEY